MITLFDFKLPQQTFGALDPYDFNQTCIAISLATKKKVARLTHQKKDLPYLCMMAIVLQYCHDLECFGKFYFLSS